MVRGSWPFYTWKIAIYKRVISQHRDHLGVQLPEEKRDAPLKRFSPERDTKGPIPVPSGNLTSLWNITIYSEYSHETWWFSIVMWQFTRGYLVSDEHLSAHLQKWTKDVTMVSSEKHHLDPWNFWSMRSWGGEGHRAAEVQKWRSPLYWAGGPLAHSGRG